MNIKRALAQGQTIVGGWLQISHPSSAEAMRDCDLDFIAVDAEHGDCDLTAITNTLRGMGDTPGFVRVRENDTLAIRQPLDCGASGVFVPLVQTGEEARRAVAAAKYPPQGVRGFAYCRGNGWGKRFDAYAAEANDAVCVFVMVESLEAVQNIDDILAVDGLDGVFIGPYDLTGSMGVLGQVNHPSVIGAQQTVLDACARHGKVAGMHLVTPTPDAIRQTMAQGYRLVVLGMDTVYIVEGTRQAAKHARACIREG